MVVKLEEARQKLRKFVELAASVTPGMEELLGIQAKLLWFYYNHLKKEGFTNDQAFELVKNAAPKHLEVKLKKK